MKRLIARLLGLALLLVAVYSAGVYFFGPGAGVRAAFERYKLAVVSGDGKAEAEIVTPETLAHFDRLRRHALASDRDAVAALPFGDRLGIFNLRVAAMRNMLALDTLRIADPSSFYAAARQVLPARDPATAKWVLTAVFPTGLSEAWGTVDPSGMTIEPTMSFVMSLFGPIRYRFVKLDGRWRVDPLPLLRTSASENEYWATRMDPTGNRFIFNMSRITDPATIERAWQPLDRQ